MACGLLRLKNSILKRSLKLHIWMSTSSCKPWLLTTELEQYFPIRKCDLCFLSCTLESWADSNVHFGAQTPLNSQTMHKDLAIFFLWDFFTDYFNFLRLNVDLENCTYFPREQMWYVYICFQMALLHQHASLLLRNMYGLVVNLESISWS